MLYRARLAKKETYWWDEDQTGSFTFAAADDTQAKTFIATVVLHMNRRYEKMKEPRGISADSLCCLSESGFAVAERKVDLSDMKPAQGVRDILATLRAFYPKWDSHRGCLAGLFTSFNPIPAAISART